MSITVESLKVLRFLSNSRTEKMKFAGDPESRSILSFSVFENNVTNWMFGALPL